jgi:hypothetical protein
VVVEHIGPAAMVAGNTVVAAEHTDRGLPQGYTAWDWRSEDKLEHLREGKNHIGCTA